MDSLSNQSFTGSSPADTFGHGHQRRSSSDMDPLQNSSTRAHEQQQQQQQQQEEEEEEEETETLISSDLDSTRDNTNTPSLRSQRSQQTPHSASSLPFQNPSQNHSLLQLQQHGSDASSNPSVTQIEQLPPADEEPCCDSTENHPIPPSADPLEPPPSSLPRSPRQPTTDNRLSSSELAPSSLDHQLTTPSTPPPHSLPPNHQQHHSQHSNNALSQSLPTNHSPSPPPPDNNHHPCETPPPALALTVSPPLASPNHHHHHHHTPCHSIALTHGAKPPQLVSPTSTLPSSDTAEPTRPSTSSYLSPTSLHFMQNMPGRSRRQLGEYTLGKTLGAGSMGKVKLAISSITGEKIAIKIIPRHTSLSAAQQQQDKDNKNKENHSSSSPSTRRDNKDQKNTGTPSHSFLEKAKNKDISKEIRTIREASIVLLLHHPYVCGMKSMLVYPHHYYMLFEYVNGGQMLDYIISHGRLRERAARKFARQMGSALEYCHANSIVHRDLKIENILISKTGNIKIIDFGLSNLFSPNSNLQTFCGSLYFAAPELLNAKAYIGPEVDVWSFGIVLFVLVCGKVPFDDQSMPALHAKIKRGQVDYPTWLSSECKHVLSRMLVTNPSNRATLQEVLNHPWIVKGYDGPPDPHIPHREPLRLNQIESEVIKGMTGFEFGSAEKIEADLRSVLSSEMYLKVLKMYDDKRTSSTNGSLEPAYNNAHSSSSSTSMSPVNGNRRDSKNDRESSSRTPRSSKRFSGFGFYGKKMAGGIAAVLNTVGGAKNDDKLNPDPNSSLSNGFESVLLNGQTLDSLDPTRGFHPLISIYFLVREKIEREKIYGPGVFASSTLSVTGPPPPPVPPSAYRSELGSHGSQLASTLPTTNELTPVARLPNKNRNTLAGSELDGKQRDQAALLLAMHQKGSTKERNGLMSIRPNTATERMVSTPLPSAPISPSQTAEFATSRAKNGSNFNPSKRRSVHVMTAPESSGVLQVMTDVVPSQRSPGSAINGSTPTNSRGDRVVSMVVEPSSLLVGPSDSERSPTSFARRFGSLLGRSSSVSDPDYKRHRPRSSIGLGHKSSSKTPLSALPQVTETSGLSPPFSPGGLQEQQQTAPQPHHEEHLDVPVDATPLSAPITGTPAPMATFAAAKSDLDANILPRTRHHHHHHHQRGSSISEQVHDNNDKVLQPTSSGPSWRPRLTSLQGKAKQPSTPTPNTVNMLSESEGEASFPLDEENEVQPLEIGSPDSTLPKQSAPLVAFSGRTAPPSSKSSDKIKPIYLKGLFSVATTSTRGPQVLRADLVAVLNRIGFQHREIKGGFECAHAPSIDLTSYGGGSVGLNVGAADHSLLPLSPPSNRGKKVESMKKKPPLDGHSDHSLHVASQPGDLTRQSIPQHGGSEGGSNLQMTPVVTGPSELGEVGTGYGSGVGGSTTVPKSPKPPSSKHANNNASNVAGLMKKYDLVVRFEIFIVKMPLLPGISGLQFRRISGNAWQYQTFARRILQELKL
ncbi:hypothetical protein PCANC_14770 [Puccinia coronata f. sp. avenae]|uniref:non-specific serine/threonine protein kinase n=1 Tax=Puccinia coronata f. sp. avenae TaxID=200324 RepID=A0A2N5UZC8_9BASI|nr:hypothetical protein PCANC_14770 [Puccinia coronata f. sp. avenae]PLW43074.1 hypothetical protein PCASD_06078 [Puccinia coronata f. sp. avenae]